jgi:hypothetical protein
MKKGNREITFRDFARLAEKRGWTVADLVDLLSDQIDDARSFFERVLSCRIKNREGRFEDRSGVVIPYRAVLRFYFKELHPEGQRAARPIPAEQAEQGLGASL